MSLLYIFFSFFVFSMDDRNTKIMLMMKKKETFVFILFLLSVCFCHCAYYYKYIDIYINSLVTEIDSYSYCLFLCTCYTFLFLYATYISKKKHNTWLDLQSEKKTHFLFNADLWYNNERKIIQVDRWSKYIYILCHSLNTYEMQVGIHRLRKE